MKPMTKWVDSNRKSRNLDEIQREGKEKVKNLMEKQCNITQNEERKKLD
jgi:hypothetical protein